MMHTKSADKGKGVFFHGPLRLELIALAQSIINRDRGGGEAATLTSQEVSNS
jgi:hypothetical protein